MHRRLKKEMAAIAETGLQEILILTGESRNKSTVEYIGEACKIARKYFKVIGLEGLSGKFRRIRISA